MNDPFSRDSIEDSLENNDDNLNSVENIDDNLKDGEVTGTDDMEEDLNADKKEGEEDCDTIKSKKDLFLQIAILPFILILSYIILSIGFFATRWLYNTRDISIIVSGTSFSKKIFAFIIYLIITTLSTGLIILLLSFILPLLKTFEIEDLKFLTGFIKFIFIFTTIGLSIMPIYGLINVIYNFLFTNKTVKPTSFSDLIEELATNMEEKRKKEADQRARENNIDLQKELKRQGKDVTVEVQTGGNQLVEMDNYKIIDKVLKGGYILVDYFDDLKNIHVLLSNIFGNNKIYDVDLKKYLDEKGETLKSSKWSFYVKYGNSDKPKDTTTKSDDEKEWLSVLKNIVNTSNDFNVLGVAFKPIPTLSKSNVYGPIIFKDPNTGLYTANTSSAQVATPIAFIGQIVKGAFLNKFPGLNINMVYFWLIWFLIFIFVYIAYEIKYHLTVCFGFHDLLKDHDPDGGSKARQKEYEEAFKILNNMKKSENLQSEIDINNDYYGIYRNIKENVIKLKLKEATVFFNKQEKSDTPDLIGVDNYARDFSSPLKYLSESNPEYITRIREVVEDFIEVEVIKDWFNNKAFQKPPVYTSTKYFDPTKTFVLEGENAKQDFDKFKNYWDLRNKKGGIGSFLPFLNLL